MKLILNSKFYSYIVFLLLLAIGLIFFRDFGIYGDEPVHRWIGSIYYLHIKEILINFNFNNEYLEKIKDLSNDEQFRLWIHYPIFFDLLTEFINDLFNINTSNNIFKTRHLTNFLIFFLSLVFFYKIILERFKNSYLAILGVILIFSSPRIFAESFYNSKDILFLSLTIINVYFSIKFINSQNNKNLFLYSLTAGLLINARIMGILLPLVTFSIILFDAMDNSKTLLKKTVRIFLSSLIISSTVIIFWPFLWIDPFKNIGLYMEFVQNLPAVMNLYFGQHILSYQTPWHFIPVWMSITIPVATLFFSLFGFGLLILKFISRLSSIDKTNNMWFDKNELEDFFIFFLLFLPLITALIFKNNFDGWRHYYYLYPLLIYHLIYFLHSIRHFKFKFFKIVNILIIINILFTVKWIFNFHPYQYVYFNSISKNFVKNSFDLDYFGLSIKDSLNYILEHDDREKIKIAAIGEAWIKGPMLILSEPSQKRIIISNLDDADYLIDTFRAKVSKKKRIDSKSFSKYHDIIIDKKIINTTYKKNKTE
tara:strand:- start:7562 stop:9172 length:1611 start_codon:yes stop_codon:yes gene_type:complete